MKTLLDHFDTLVIPHDEVKFSELYLNNDIGSPELILVCNFINYKIATNSHIKIILGNTVFKDPVVQKIFEMIIYNACLKTNLDISIDVTDYYDGEDILKLNFMSLYFTKHIYFLEDKILIKLDKTNRISFIALMEKKFDYDISESDTNIRIRFKLERDKSIDKSLGIALPTLNIILHKDLRMGEKDNLIEDINNLISESYTNARDHSDSSLFVDIDIIKLKNFDVLSYVAFNCSELFIYSPLENLIEEDIQDNYKDVIHQIKDEVLNADWKDDDKKRAEFLFEKICEVNVSTRDDTIDEEDSGIGIRRMAQRINSYNTFNSYEFENYFMSNVFIMSTKFSMKGESAFSFPGTLIHGNMIKELKEETCV